MPKNRPSLTPQTIPYTTLCVKPQKQHTSPAFPQPRDPSQLPAEQQKSRPADNKRQRINHDKTIRLNDLKSFSKNFSLATPVPKEMVPILSKEKKQQQQQEEKISRREEARAEEALSPTSAWVEEQILLVEHRGFESLQGHDSGQLSQSDSPTWSVSPEPERGPESFTCFVGCVCSMNQASSTGR